MNSFLYNLAENFYKIYGNQISDFTFVFPNRRSGVFFQRYLSQVADNVMFSPQISTINELFQSMSSLKMIDKTRLLFTIYNIYKRETESSENFDEFIYWGEMLLNDFDDIDKYMVDAKKLFTNITDLKQIDDEFAFLEEEQIEIVRKFWVNFIPSFSSDKKVNFIHIWEKLYAIYIGLKNNLKTDGLGYEGMIYRDVIDSLEKGQTLLKLKTTKIIFIGFNALTTCEKRLMNNLRDKDIADFYWDYDDEILKDRNNKASFFYYDNVNNYPSQISINPNIDLKKKNIEVLGIPSGIGQAKYIPEIIEDLISEGKISDPKHALETAIVLADENLLIPTLYSIPENINPINVTMGKSLKNTPIAGLLDHIFDLQLNLNFKNKDTLFYYKDVLAVLNHTFIMFYDEKTTLQLIKQITKENKIYLTSEELSGNELLSRIFKPVNSVGKALAYLRKILELLQNESSEIDDENEVRKLSELEKEFIYHYYITLNRLNDVLNEFSVEIKVRTFFRLLSKMTENISVPFHGEPLSGLQIMGVLETRALDFKNLIILSMNEGVFPLKKSANSFIPVNLRKGFGLSTNEHQDAIYAYHFYRMISRAENVFLLYDTRSNGLQTGEVSRYVYQMKYHYGIELKEKTVTYDIGISKYSPINIDKSDRIFNKLNKFLSDDNKRFLSASSINSYINCPLQFYFKFIENVEDPDQVEENMENNTFGTIFHAVMEEIYKRAVNQVVMADWLKAVYNDEVYLRSVIRDKFNEFYLHNNNEDLNGYNYLIGEVFLKYTRKVLEADMKYTPFRYVGSEVSFKTKYEFNKNQFVNLKGSIDRIDEKDESVRIIDYKTGNGEIELQSIEQLFDPSDKKRPKAIMQTFLYSMLYNSLHPCKRIVPEIFYLRDFFKLAHNSTVSFTKKAADPYIPGKISNFIEFENDFKESLNKTLIEIFNKEIPFTQTENTDICKYCEMNNICKR